MPAPVVVKFGGDALATPERIAQAARRVAALRREHPVVAVASARRGVTDHLLGLVAGVAEAAGSGYQRLRRHPAAERAVSAGEVVSASLLALALEAEGVPAEPLDAREAGLASDGHWSRARLRHLRPRKVRRLLAGGAVPVVTGFQGWHQGRVTTLGRGGSDTTAVALAVALGAERCEFVKDVAGLHTADPKRIPSARPLPVASLRFLAELARAGARVIHPEAAAIAERNDLPLAFTSLPGGLGTRVGARHPAAPGPVAVVAQNARALLLLSLPAETPRAHLPALRHHLEEVDPCALLAFGRDEAGWRLALAVDERAGDEVHEVLRALAPAAALNGERRGLAAVSLVGAELTPDLLGRFRTLVEASAPPGARTWHAGARLSVLARAEAADELATALHGAFVEGVPGVEPVLTECTA